MIIFYVELIDGMVKKRHYKLWPSEEITCTFLHGDTLYRQYISACYPSKEFIAGIRHQILTSVVVIELL